MLYLSIRFSRVHAGLFRMVDVLFDGVIANEASVAAKGRVDSKTKDFVYLTESQLVLSKR